MHQEAVALHELPEGVADGITCSADADSLHHPRVAELPSAQISVKYL